MPPDDYPQMSPEEVDGPDMAFAYAMQTHLCWSHVQPGDLSFRVVRDRLTSVGYGVAALDRSEPAAGLRETLAVVQAVETTHATQHGEDRDGYPYPMATCAAPECRAVAVCRIALAATPTASPTATGEREP